MKSAEVIVFDLDQTLTESKAPLDLEMSALLGELLKVKKVAVISGASYEQFEKQFLKHLSPTPEILKNLYLLPTNGASLYEYRSGWEIVYHHELSEKDKKKIFETFEEVFAEIGFEKPKIIYGRLIEDRGAQITFSGLGSEAPLSIKEKWDKDFSKRKILAESLQRKLPEFSIGIGGATSIDVTLKGINKAYGLKELMRYLGYGEGQVFYIGDAFFPGGNDSSVISLDIPYQSVEGKVENTKKIIRRIISKTDKVIYNE